MRHTFWRTWFAAVCLTCQVTLICIILWQMALSVFHIMFLCDIGQPCGYEAVSL